MTNTTTLNIQIDRDLMARADALFAEMGTSLATAVNVFIRQSVKERASKNVTIDQRRMAMQEIRDMLSGVDGNDIDLAQMN